MGSEMCIRDRFPRGQIAFDGYSGAMVRMVSRLATVRGAKVKLLWGIDDPRDLERQIPKLRLVEDVEFLTMPSLVAGLSKGWLSRKMHAVLGRVPFYRNLVHHVRYEF